LLEELEPRLVLNAQPTAYEQMMLEQLNAIRANPAAYGASIGLNLSNVAPSQPLAFDLGLVQAAEGHSEDMNANAYFAHTAPDGSTPGDRMTAAGVPWISYGESIAAGYTSTAAALQGLITDAGVRDLGHRLQLLAMTPEFQAQQEVGIGVVLNGSGPYSDYYTIDTTVTADTRPFLTGVVYNDANHNGTYDVGEGLGGVTLSIAGVGAISTFSSGGYSWQLNPGTYTVTASGPGLPGPITKTVVLSSTNVELDFTSASVSVSSVAADNAWVAQQYQTLLHRTGSQTELTYWTNQLVEGASQAAVIAAIEATPEFAKVSTAWVENLYQDLLGRVASTTEANYWVHSLQAGASPANVATAMMQSPEYQKDQWLHWIPQAYENILRRQPTATEVSEWVNAFKGGLTQNELTAALVSSTEDAALLATNSSSNWIASVYGELLLRTASTSEIAYWSGVIQNGASRQTVVELIEQSAEYRQLQGDSWVQGLYQNLLKRTGSSSEVGYWTNQLLNGTSQETVLVDFLISNEFYLVAMNG